MGIWVLQLRLEDFQGEQIQSQERAFELMNIEHREYNVFGIHKTWADVIRANRVAVQ